MKSRILSDIIVDTMVVSACRMISDVCTKVDAMTPEERKAFDIGANDARSLSIKEMAPPEKEHAAMEPCRTQAYPS